MTTTTKSTRRTYRERRDARAERLREWAAKRETRAEQAAASVDTLTSLIPLGSRSYAATIHKNEPNATATAS